MTNIPRMRMHSSTHGTHPLKLHGAAPIAVEAGYALVPYPQVRNAMALNWGLDPSQAWPPRRSSMSPPEPLTPGDVVPLPDGGEIAITAPFSQVVEIPERFVRAFESRGWVSLAQFA